MSNTPRFRFVATLGVYAQEEDARRTLVDGLGFREISADACHVAFSLDAPPSSSSTAIFVDTTNASKNLQGFTPMFACENLSQASDHLAGQGCAITPMPWSGPGMLVEGPGGLRFCIAEMVEVSAVPTNDAARDHSEPHPSHESSNTNLQMDAPAPKEEDLWEDTATEAVVIKPLGYPEHTIDGTDSRAAMTAPTSMPLGDETQMVSRQALDAILLSAGFRLAAEPPAVGRNLSQPFGHDLDATAVGSAVEIKPSMLADRVTAPPYSEFDREDPTSTGAPSSSLLDRAGGRSDVTQLGPPSKALLNMLAGDGDDDDDDDDDGGDARARAPARAVNNPAPFAANQDEGLQDELLQEERRHQERIDEIHSRRRKTNRARKERTGPIKARPIGAQLESAMQDKIIAAAPGDIDLDDETLGETRSTLSTHDDRKVPPPLPATGAAKLSSGARRPAARSRHALDVHRPSPLLFGDDDDDKTAAPPPPVETEELGAVFTKSDDHEN